MRKAQAIAAGAGVGSVVGGFLIGGLLALWFARRRSGQPGFAMLGSEASGGTPPSNGNRGTIPTPLVSSSGILRGLGGVCRIYSRTRNGLIKSL